MTPMRKVAIPIGVLFVMTCVGGVLLVLGPPQPKKLPEWQIHEFHCCPDASLRQAYLRQHAGFVNLTDPDNLTALSRVACFGTPEMVRELIDVGADVNHVSDLNTTALSDAVGRRRVNVARVLLEAGADPNFAPHEWVDEEYDHRYQSTLVSLAARKGEFELLRMLVEHGGNLNGDRGVGRNSALEEVLSSVTYAIEQDRWDIAPKLKSPAYRRAMVAYLIDRTDIDTIDGRVSWIVDDLREYGLEDLLPEDWIRKAETEPKPDPFSKYKLDEPD